MAHDKNCRNCGKAFNGNINRMFCTDACRKYFKRHGQTSITGLQSVSNADKGGEVRNTPRSGGSSVGNYAAKKGIDFFAKMLETSLEKPKEGLKTQNHGILNTATNTPLQVVKASSSMNDPNTKVIQNRVLFSADFANFLGQVSYPFKMLVWGLPGSGKSTFCMKLVNEIASMESLLYIAGEEALNSPTLLDKQRRTLTPQNAAKCVFLNRLPKSETEWKQLLPPFSFAQPITHKAVFYDSVTKLGITPFYVDAAANDFNMPSLAKSISHVFITHAHKDGQQYRGDGSWGHEVDVIVRVEKGIAVTEKNRFGEVGHKLTIF